MSIIKSIIKFKQKVLPKVQVLSKDMSCFSVEEANKLIEAHRAGMSIMAVAHMLADARRESK